MTVAGIILAAGGGSRFEGAEHKLLARFRGRPVVSWVLDAALAAGLDHLYLVSGAVNLDELAPPEVTIVHNRRWADGQATSLALAVASARADGHDAVVVGLGDQPLVPAEAWRAVAAAPGPIAVALFDGARRPPVRLDRSVWVDLPRSGDEGARALIKQRIELVSEVSCRGNPVDIDTLEDLRRWS